MKGIKFGSKKRDPKGEGRAVIYKPVQLPVDLIEDFKLYKDAYSRLRESRPDPVLYPVDPCEGDI